MVCLLIITELFHGENGKKSNIVISGPQYGDVASYVNFLQGTSNIAKLMDSLLEWNPDIANRIKLSSLLHPEAQLNGRNIGRLGLLITGDLVSGGGVMSIETHDWCAAAFCILEGCGLFAADSSYPKFYHFAVPNLVPPAVVIKSTLGILESRDEEGILHPESIVSCVDDDPLPKVLEHIEEDRAYASVGLGPNARVTA